MIKKLIAVIGTLTVIALVGLFVVGTAFAQSPTPPANATPQTPWGGAWGRVCGGAGVVSDAVTKLLGMTQEQIYTERQAGKTLTDIAKEKGIADQQLIDAMTAGQKQVIEQAVTDGRLTQAQADWMLARMQTMAPFMLNNPFSQGQGHGGMRAGGRGSMMQGGRRGWAPQQAPTAPAASGTSL